MSAGKKYFTQEYMSEKKPSILPQSSPTKEPTSIRDRVKFEIYGEEMIEKEVKQSGNSGRVYLPPDWVEKHVKIIRID